MPRRAPAALAATALPQGMKQRRSRAFLSDALAFRRRFRILAPLDGSGADDTTRNASRRLRGPS